MNDWNGSFELVNPAEIVVDHRYQRAERAALIATISSNPTWEAFSVVTCVKRTNGVLYAIDGQQRLRGIQASKEPPKKVPVVWFPIETIEDESRVFSAINEARKALFPIEKHTARTIAKDPTALGVNRAVEKTGFSIGQNAESSRTILAISALHSIYDSYSEEGLVQTLTVIREAWPDDKAAVGPQIMKAVSEVIGDQNGGYSRQKLTAALAKTSPAKILRKAEELTFDMGGSKQANVRRAFKALAKV